MVNLEEFLVSDEAFERLSDEEILSRHLAEGKPMQELFGFTNEVMAEFYETAKSILEQKRHEEAIDVFVFLTTMNPYISDFWMGLGMAHQHNKSYDDALFSYSVAFTLEGRDIFPYILAAQCCLETKDFDKAIEILETAEHYAEEHSEEEECKTLKEEAISAKKYVLEEQKKVA
ncbi:MAG: tetratricopeptide repeat protein [Waddliaceae bacterium]